MKTNTVSDEVFLQKDAEKKRAQTANAQTSSVPTSAPRQPLILTFVRFPLVFSSTSCWYICKKSSSQQMKLTVHPIRARPGRARPGPNPSKSVRRSVLSALAPLPRQRRSDALIPLACAVWHRHDVRPTRRTRFDASVWCSQPD